MSEQWELLVRVAILMGALSQAWRGWRRMRQGGTRMLRAGIGHAVVACGLLVYLASVVTLVIWVTVAWTPSASPWLWMLAGLGCLALGWLGLLGVTRLAAALARWADAPTEFR